MSNVLQQTSNDEKIIEDFLKRVKEYCGEPLPEGGVRIERALFNHNELVLVVHNPGNDGDKLAATRLVDAIRECVLNNITVQTADCSLVVCDP
jgi:hypothetical protein